MYERALVTRIYLYKNSILCLDTCKGIVSIKISREQYWIKSHGYKVKSFQVDKASTTEELLLVEAQAAKYFWRCFSLSLISEYHFTGRVQGGTDVVNRLLDIGFHHLFGIVSKLLETHSIPLEVGLLHTAHQVDSKPLVYDLVELFRADLVATEVVTFLHAKKNVSLS